MKSIVKKVLVVMMSVIVLSASVVMAGEGESTGDSLGDLLGGLTSGEFNLEETLGSLSEKLSGVQGSLGEILENLNLGEMIGGLKEKLSEITGKIGGLPEDLNLDELLGGLKEKLSGMTGTEDPDDTEDLGLDIYDLNYTEINDAISRHLQEETKDYLEGGDAQVCSLNVAAEQSEEDRTVRILGYFIVSNFDAEGSDLLLKNSASTTELLTLTREEGGVYEVTDYQTVPDGDDYAENLEPLCESMGITTDTFYNGMLYIDMTYAVDLYAFLSEHSEYERMECNGELLTLEDLEAVIDAEIENMVDMISEEAENE